MPTIVQKKCELTKHNSLVQAALPGTDRPKRSSGDEKGKGVIESECSVLSKKHQRFCEIDWSRGTSSVADDEKSCVFSVDGINDTPKEDVVYQTDGTHLPFNARRTAERLDLKLPHQVKMEKDLQVARAGVAKLSQDLEVSKHAHKQDLEASKHAHNAAMAKLEEDFAARLSEVENRHKEEMVSLNEISVASARAANESAAAVQKLTDELESAEQEL